MHRLWEATSRYLEKTEACTLLALQLWDSIDLCCQSSALSPHRSGPSAPAWHACHPSLLHFGGLKRDWWSWQVDFFEESFLAAAEWSNASIKSRRPHVRHQYCLHKELKSVQGWNMAGCMTSRQSLKSGWRKASELRGKNGMALCRGLKQKWTG